jgi:hypothetical protein
VFYVLFIVMAGLLIGTRGGLVTAAVCFLGAIVLTAGTALGWLTPRPGAGSRSADSFSCASPSASRWCCRRW